MAFTETVRHMNETQSLHEGKLTSSIEKQTAKLPSMLYMNLALASIAASITIAASTKKAEWANFVGLWAPSFMLIGIYNKLVKQEPISPRG